MRGGSRKKKWLWPRYRESLGYDENLPAYLIVGGVYETKIEASAFSCILARNYKGELTTNVLPNIRFEVVLTNSKTFRFKINKGMINFISGMVAEAKSKAESSIRQQEEKQRVTGDIKLDLVEEMKKMIATHNLSEN